VGLQSRRGATVKALSFVDTRILSRASLLRSLKMYPYEKAVLKAEAGRRAHESCTRVGKVTDLQKKSGLLSKLLMLGKDNPEVDRAKKESKDRRCLSSMQRRIELSPAISPARTPRSGSKDIKMRGSLTQLPSSLQSSLQLPSAMSEFDNRRISNVGKMKIFGNKRMSISQGMGRTRRWSVCGSGGYAKQENISLCIMPPITVQESDYDSLSIISTDTDIKSADMRRNTGFSNTSSMDPRLRLLGVPIREKAMKQKTPRAIAPIREVSKVSAEATLEWVRRMKELEKPRKPTPIRPFTLGLLLGTAMPLYWWPNERWTLAMLSTKSIACPIRKVRSRREVFRSLVGKYWF